MSKIKPMGLVESMSGKICGHSDMYFFRKNGKVFSGKICNPSTKEPTALQLAKRTKFAQARAAVETHYIDIIDPERYYVEHNPTKVV